MRYIPLAVMLMFYLLLPFLPMLYVGIYQSEKFIDIMNNPRFNVSGIESTKSDLIALEQNIIYTFDIASVLLSVLLSLFIFIYMVAMPVDRYSLYLLFLILIMTLVVKYLFIDNWLRSVFVKMPTIRTQLTFFSSSFGFTKELPIFAYLFGMLVHFLRTKGSESGGDLT